MCDACTIYDNNKKEADTISSLNESVFFNKKEITPFCLEKLQDRHVDVFIKNKC